METYTKDALDISKYDDVLGLFENLPSILSPEGSPTPKYVKARKEVCYRVADLFPLFTDNGVHDEFMSDYSLEQYGYYRSLGLSVADTAYSLELSATRLTSLLSGEGLSLEKFVNLVKVELFARAKFKARLLRDIEQSSGTQNWKTSLTLLEKLYPEEFGSAADKSNGIMEEEQSWVINIVDAKVPAEPTKEVTK